MGRQVGNQIKYSPRWRVLFVVDNKIVGINYFGTLYKMARYFDVTHSRLCGVLYGKVSPKKKELLNFCKISRTYPYGGAKKKCPPPITLSHIL